MADASGDKRPEYLTSKQLAEVLQISEATVRRLRQSGKIPSFHLTDRLVRFNLRDVRTALARAEKARVATESEHVEEVDTSQMNFYELTGFEDE